MRNVFSSVNSSLVLGLSAVVGCTSLLSRVKPLTKVWFQLAPVSWPSCRQQASLFMHGHGRTAFSVTDSSFIPDSGPPMPYFPRYKRPSIVDVKHHVYLLTSPNHSPSQTFKDRALFCSHFAKSPGQSPSQSLSLQVKVFHSCNQCIGSI